MQTARAGADVGEVHKIFADGRFLLPKQPTMTKKRGTIVVSAAAALLASPADAFVALSRSLPSSAAGSLSPCVPVLSSSATENDEPDTSTETTSINGANGDAAAAEKDSAPSPPPPPSPAKEATEAIVDMINEVATAPQRTILLNDLLRTASSCGRGEFATPDDKTRMAGIIAELEELNPTDEPTMSTSGSGSDESSSSSKTIEGTWELLYSDTQLFRSSPFFMAGRAVCSTPEEAERYDWFCDMHRAALAISNIGKVRQIISADRMVSEFEVKVGSIPFLNDFTPFAYSGGLPVTIEGAIVSSADITPTDDGRAWEIFMDTVEIKGSNVPLLRQLLDGGVKLGSRDLGSFLEDTVESYTNPKPVFETTYLDDGVRISRDQDGKVFVYGKVDDSTEPTDYKNVDADLGVARLLEGLNDSIFKFYI